MNKLENYTVLVENTPDLLYRTDIDGRITFISSSVEKLSGFTVEEALGMHMAKEVYLFPEQREKFLALLRKDGRVRNFVAQLKRKDGTHWWASTNAHLYTGKDGKVLGVEGITRDISELKKAEEDLQKSEELFRIAFHTSPDAINLNRAVDGVFIDANEGFCRLLGYSQEDVIGKSSLELQVWRNPEDRNRLITELEKNGYAQNLEAEFLTKNGNIKIGLMSARCIEVNNEKLILSITRDITDHKLLERQLQEAQKMEAVGRLAGGIAHDFNNILSAILGNAEMGLLKLAKQKSVSDNFEAIMRAAKRARDLVGQILTFSSKQEQKSISLKPSLVVNEALKLLRPLIPSSIEIRSSIRSQERILADPTQIHQIVMNLCTNGYHAMKDKGGILSVTLDDLIIPGMSQQTKDDLPVERYIRMEVSDTGCGMDQATLEKIFDPYFTTQEKGSGTGLGLAVVHGIVKTCGGHIKVHSKLDEGTTFRLLFPCVDKEDVHREHSLDREIHGGSERILLVDDEEDIIKIVTAMLEHYGYTVTPYLDSEQALSHFLENPKAVDLVITDLTMPRLSGYELAYGLLEKRSDLPVIICTGFNESDRFEEAHALGIKRYLQKPVDMHDMLATIREVLE